MSNISINISDWRKFPGSDIINDNRPKDEFICASREGGFFPHISSRFFCAVM
jgi:hypothetical protein